MTVQDNGDFAKSAQLFGGYRATPSKAFTKSSRSILARVFRATSSPLALPKGTKNGTIPTSRRGLTSSAGGKQYRSKSRMKNNIRVTVSSKTVTVISSRLSRRERGNLQKRRIM